MNDHRRAQRCGTMPNQRQSVFLVSVRVTVVLVASVTTNHPQEGQLNEPLEESEQLTTLPTPFRNGLVSGGRQATA